MKNEMKQSTKNICIFIVIIAFAGLVSYALKYPYEAWKSIYGGAGAVLIWSLHGYFADRKKNNV